MTTYRRAPRPVSLSLDHIRDELEPDSLLAEVQGVWPRAVGAAIAGEGADGRAGGACHAASASVGRRSST